MIWYKMKLPPFFTGDWRRATVENQVKNKIEKYWLN